MTTPVSATSRRRKVNTNLRSSEVSSTCAVHSRPAAERTPEITTVWWTLSLRHRYLLRVETLVALRARIAEHGLRHPTIVERFQVLED